MSIPKNSLKINKKDIYQLLADVINAFMLATKSVTSAHKINLCLNDIPSLLSLSFPLKYSCSISFAHR